MTRRVAWLVAALLVLPALVPLQAVASDTAPAYTVGPGDVLKVESFQHDEISGEFPVDEKGQISFPLLDRVPVAGLTVGQIADRLKNALEKDFYVSVQIQVSVAKYGSRPVTVIGEVGSPGTYFLKGRTTLPQIIAEAGGLKATAGHKIEIRRPARTPGGEEKTIVVEARDLAQMGSDPVVQAGDVISVAARQLYFITGEVMRPGRYELQDKETLMQAISQAGGLGKFASQNVEIHREAAGKKTITTVNLKRIRQGKVKDPRIAPNDVIIVRRRFF